MANPLNTRLSTIAFGLTGVLALIATWVCGLPPTTRAAEALQDPPPRGELPPAEQATVDLFEDVHLSVVYITTSRRWRSAEMC